MSTFLNSESILSLFNKVKTATNTEAEKIIDNALKLKGLSPEETAILLQCKDPEILNKTFKAAKIIKEEIYGKRLVIFAPLYITNYCANNCLYCGFRTENNGLKRKRLSLKEIEAEVRIIEDEGQKRILLVAGEDSETSNIDFLEGAISTIYATKQGRGEIRRLNVNVAPMTVKNFKRLKKTGIGTYQLFQETYHPGEYKQTHFGGPKSNYQDRLYAMHRAQEAGIDDVGIGVLFGLADYRFEVLALLYHALELEKQFGVGPHTISIPRIEPAFNAPLANQPPAPVSDADFKKLVAILRLAVPYTGMILSTRESAKIRNEVIGLGISQISAGSRTTPGGYKYSEQEHPESEQFSLHDSRSLLEVIKDISHLGYSPSFCTACYRLGRTGKDFMDLARPGLIHKHCLPNSLLTFKEYLIDYGDAEARELGKKIIQEQLNEIDNPQRKAATVKRLKELETGTRDLYF
ncbi:[FeFe] hydrogenase H-cluster radical SAM maturase HydG [candidate division WOR-1 bacterium RIFCSPLOWO2_02_FULL_46_20]|uniref:[FeFe] hydrogenase H-cluster radical SAM maturase HydG n=1 Tax=candidate division WOR-1 bacterium RIFCSPLOWO2_02_FULL_46_20 TaxID=1802567 RepID=A0A1F4R440_UNCSA|nr:MAG: [FeFe] hydrogenase H-cluster radical SAM maturase HydG [candidate division WOR-1 bacterium RIFCSPLOWO2_02_FULL_46_20]